MKEPDEVKNADRPTVLSREQSADSNNIHDVRELIDAFATNARGVKALKTFHKSMFDSLMSLLDTNITIELVTKEQIQLLSTIM